MAGFRDRFATRRVLWQTYYSSYVIGLHDCVPVGMVLAFDEGLDTEEIGARAGIRFFSLEGRAGIRAGLDEPAIDQIARRWEAEIEADLGRLPAERWVAVSQNPAKALPRLAARLGVPCSVVGWEEFERFGSKATLHRAVGALGLPGAGGQWLRLGGAKYGELAQRFGSRFVIQLDHGNTGNGTAFVRDERSYAAAGERFAGKDVWVAPHIGELSLNINAVATGAGTAVGYPSVQVVGHSELRSKPGVHCGNDFSAAADLPAELRESVREQTERLGNWMAGQGYRGLFGLDYVVDEASGRPCVVDLNPRWQGSTSLETQAALRQGRLPLAAAEVAMRAGVMSEGELMEMAETFFLPLEGSQIFLKAPPGGPWAAQGELAPGVYAAGLERKRAGLKLGDLQTASEVVLNGHNPRRGRPMEGAVRLCRVCGLNRAVDPGNGRLESWAAGVAARIEARIELAAADYQTSFKPS